MIFRSITLQEANLFLPILKEHISKIHLLVTEGHVLQERILGSLAQLDTTGVPNLSKEAEEARERLKQIELKIRDEMMGIQQYGALVKSIFPARIDFRAERHQQPVFLCWEGGEDEIRHWHPVDESFLTRRGIENPEEFGSTVVH
ncbi:MAG: DUF2203 family protein [Myxococcota bacterium]